MNMNSYSDLEHLELVAQRLAEAGKDITADHGDWIDVTFACASLGEQAREAYHTICSLYPGYKREECDEKFDNCLKTGHGLVTLGTLMKLAQDAGVDITLPRGRRQKSEEQKKAEQVNRIQAMREALLQQAEWRFNTWRQRPEVREKGQSWKPVQDRDLDTYYCRLKEQGLNVKLQDVKSLIFSRDFCQDYDAVSAWLNSLKPWNPETDPDYLKDFYVGHLEFGDPENEPFYDQMLKKWHVALVALMRGRINENPQMPIFKGHQHIGKTFFVRHILPPELSDYRLEVGPSERIDKDFVISLSETPLILFDEISFGSSQKNEAFKYIVTSSKSNVRDAYAHFRESRQRRASLIATTNEDNFIRDSQGNRRYLAIDLKGTVDLDAFPLPYEGAYAQALYLLDHGFDPKPTQEESQLISEHNRSYMESNDCEEALRTILSLPDGQAAEEALSAGDIMRELTLRGFRGRDFTTNSIGKTMKQLGFESKVIRGTRKYLVVRVDYDMHSRENKLDARMFVPEVF
ncbi:MAG: PriCT-2 domain-containing protein [Prevotella sp.]|nr:PriCT-2 domain-containing protein [Prevotella sp.]